MSGIRRPWANGMAGVLSLVYLLPLCWIVLSALKDDDVIRGAPNALAFTPSLDTFRDVIDLGGSAILVSARIAIATTLIVIVLAVPAAYAVSWLPSRRWRRIATAALAVLMVLQMVPQPMAVIPLFSILAKWRLIGNVAGVVMADVALLLPFAILLLRPFVMGIPKDLYEAADLDGATGFQRFRLLVLPLVANGILTVGAIVFILAWGEFIYATTFLTEQSRLPVSGLLAQQTNLYSVAWNRLMALAVLTALPLLLVFVVAQRRLVQGLSVGAVK
ncbi:MAG: carbohydrate ABC transporter permease [Actinomycetota bacterium]